MSVATPCVVKLSSEQLLTEKRIGVNEIQEAHAS